MFKLHSEYEPTGDQPVAIKQLSDGIKQGKKYQTLLGVTGSGKTFTMANIIEQVQKPTLVLAHNKTLAGQLYSEFKEFFPENNVEYFVSYYDYYQPEAYIAQSDTYIEKDASINDEIDKLRHSATAALFETRDVIIVASVSCIYGLGDPIDYEHMIISLRPGMKKSRDEVLRKLISMQYVRNEMDFKRGVFRAKGDIVEIYPSDENEKAIRIEFWGDEIDKITEINPLTGKPIAVRNHVMIFPNSHYVTTSDKMERALVTIEKEMKERGWQKPDFVLVTGDAYVDHHSFGTAIIGRLLEQYGYKVAILPQPNYKSAEDFRIFGKPRLGFLINSGVVDSMVNNYSVFKHRRKTDEYAPGGKTGLRPDRAVIVYANRAKEAYKDVPVIIGGLEASLRRFGHYDYWSDKVRRSVLLDSKADLLIYGMGERAILEIAEAMDSGIDARDITWIRGSSL